MLKPLLVATCACSLGLILLSAARAADDPAVGKTVANFTLRDFHGNSHSLEQYAEKKAVVLVFLGAECPLAKLYAPRLATIAREYAERGVLVVGVDANMHDTPTKLTNFVNANQLEFPLLKDAGNVLADAVGATRTPEVFLLDQKRVVRYHGRVDDQYGVSGQRSKPMRRDLAEAIDELLAGKPVSQPTSDFSGCLISRVSKIEPHGEITYSKQVASIFNRRCVECHREHELAPFPLTSYDEVVGWAATIREVVSENRMPPWFADPQFGKFGNDCSLSSHEKQTILSWIDNGCPEGNKSEAPAPPAFTVGWRIGKPDAVYQMKEPYAVPAEGTVDYQYFEIDPGFKEDVWITSAEARPGNTAVVHHVVLFAVPPGRVLQNPEEAQAVGQIVALYAPGMNPWRYPQGAAVRVEAGTKFYIQLHYTPNGTKQTDRSYVGLNFAKPGSVKKRVRYNMSVNTNFEIPPGADNAEVISRVLILKDTLLLNLFPHMHYRGKAFRFELEFADGRRETLLDVPRYDFAWQLRYDLAEPKLMPKGSRLICTAHYDNSEANPYNPDPTKTVRFGLQTYEEMMVGYYSTIPVADEVVQNPDAKDLRVADAVGKSPEAAK